MDFSVIPEFLVKLVVEVEVEVLQWQTFFPGILA